jgi:hypothetical protein
MTIVAGSPGMHFSSVASIIWISGIWSCCNFERNTTNGYQVMSAEQETVGFRVHLDLCYDMLAGSAPGVPFVTPGRVPRSTKLKALLILSASRFAAAIVVSASQRLWCSFGAIFAAV